MFESIAIVGDIHIREEAPRSRTDNYFDTCMNKIDKLMAKHKYVIILGDFFDKSNIPVEYLNEAIDRLSKYTGRIYTVLGNHDAHYRTLKLNKTSIGLLDKVGVVQLKLDSFSIEGISFDVASVVPELKLPEKKSNILLGHFYLEKSGQAKESMHTEDLLEYEYVFLGHEHEPQEPLQIGNTTIFRNGSLLRKDVAGLKNVFQNKIIPLLQEYFYGDYGKIGLVLREGFFMNGGKQDNTEEYILEDFNDYRVDDLNSRLSLLL